MDAATLLYLMGAGFCILGILMIVFRQIIGVTFGRIGKCLCGLSPFEGLPVFDAMVHRIYDERHAPGVFRMLGIVYIVQGLIFFVLGFLLSWR